MREAIGVPKSCLGTYAKGIDFWVALLKYDDFVVVYESGINEIPVFDCFIEVVGKTKSVRVTFDTPYVKGLPITLTIREKIDGRPGTNAHGVQERIVRRTFEDPYTLEWEHFYECIVEGKAPKTSAKDSRDDLDVYRLILQAGDKAQAQL
jgi:predicted dehydrogenase